MGRPSSSKPKDNTSESLQRLQDQLVLAQHEGDTRAAKLIKLIIKRTELKKIQGY